VSATLYDSIARIARHEAAARAVAGVGKVTDLFTADAAQQDHAVTVQMRDSGLILPRVPVAVGAMGFAAIPAVDDLVIVLFLEGDLNAPVVVGRLYHPDQNPPEHSDGQVVLALPSGASPPDMKLIVVGADSTIRLTIGEDVEVSVTDEKIALRVGELRATLDGAGSGQAEIAAGGSKITIRQDGDITISAGGNIKLEGAEIEISGSAKVKISGAEVDIN
jgi:uncharacterized protein involved in type VI secretion and phage assembly